MNDVALLRELTTSQIRGATSSITTHFSSIESMLNKLGSDLAGPPARKAPEHDLVHLTEIYIECNFR